MQPLVLAQLAMECDSQQLAFSHCDRVPIDLTQDLHIGTVLGHPGSPDEDPAQRWAIDPADLEVGLETTNLTTKSVALRTHVHQAQVL